MSEQRLYLSLIPQALVASMLPPEEFGRYYATGKTSVAIPCYGERALGQVADDELAIALPP